MISDLRPYQTDVFDAVARSVAEREGLTFTVEIARQGALAHAFGERTLTTE